jgi:hypothetical protein
MISILLLALALRVLAVSSDMKLDANQGSDRAWAYAAVCDFSEGEAARVSFAFRFKDAQSALVTLSIFNDSFCDKIFKVLRSADK